MRKMKAFIIYLLLGLLLGIMLPLSFAQENQDTQKLDTGIKALEKRISELENQLQTLENVEKMELTAKLAEANAKLANAEFGRFERELRDANDEWLRSWSNWFVVIFGTFVVILLGVAAVFWFWLRSRADQLIANSVERSLSGFKESLVQVDALNNELKEAVKQVNILQDQIRILEKERAASMLEATFQPNFGSELGYPKENEARREEALKEFSEEALLNVFDDNKYHFAVRHKAAEILVKKSPPLISPLLALLNTAINPDSDNATEIGQNRLRNSIALLAGIKTLEVYNGLTQFLNRLLIESPEHKDLFLTWTVFSLVYIGDGLNNGDSVPMLRKAIPHLDVKIQDEHALKDLVEYFDRFDEPEGIRNILTNNVTYMIPELETRCLELLQKPDPEFVEDWKARKAAADTETEESA